jgi:hypothetical protein
VGGIVEGDVWFLDVIKPSGERVTFGTGEADVHVLDGAIIIRLPDVEGLSNKELVNVINRISPFCAELANASGRRIFVMPDTWTVEVLRLASKGWAPPADRSVPNT